MEQTTIQVPSAQFNKLIDVATSGYNAADKLLSIAESAKYLRCSIPTFSKIRKESKLKETHIRGRIFFKKIVLDNYLKEKEVANG